MDMLPAVVRERRWRLSSQDCGPGQVAHGGDWLAGPVDVLDASVERTGMGSQRRRTKASHLTRLTAFLKLPPSEVRERDRWEEGDAAALPAVVRERR